MHIVAAVMKELTSVDDIIDTLGGTFAVARIAALGITPQGVSNWRKRGRLPAEKYLVMTAELRRRGYTAPAAIFGIPEAAE